MSVVKANGQQVDEGCFVEETEVASHGRPTLTEATLDPRKDIGAPGLDDKQLMHQHLPTTNMGSIKRVIRTQRLYERGGG